MHSPLFKLNDYSAKKRSSAGKNQIQHHKCNHKSQILSAHFKRKLGNFHPPIDYCQVSSTNTNTEPEQNTLSSSTEWPPGWEYLLKSLLYRCQESHTLYKSNALLSTSFVLQTRHLLMAVSTPGVTAFTSSSVMHCCAWSRLHLFIPATMAKGLTILSNSHNPSTAHTHCTTTSHSSGP